MITEKNFKDIVTIILIAGLIILVVLVLKPVIFPIIWGALLAYIFYPVYKWTLKIVKNENISAFLICLILLLIILIPTVLIISSLINQAINFYLLLQKTDFAKILGEILPSLSTSSTLSSTLSNSLNSFVPTIISYFISKVSSFVLNLPVILLKLFVAVFVFFFGLRDGKKGIEYIKSLSLLSKENQEKFLKQFKDITNSVLLGHGVVGVLQGLLAGVGYFVLGIPYALILTLLTILGSMIPLLGAWIVWIPVDIYLFITGKTGAGLALLIYGLFVVSIIDNILRPLIVSRKARINSAIVVIGMIGGIFVFGILGLILGPLILSYVILVIELYREKKAGESILFKKVEEKT